MSLRTYIQRLGEQGRLVRVNQPISRAYEIAGVLKQIEPSPVIFENVGESGFRVAGNLFCSKAVFADYFGISVKEIIPLLTHAIEQRSPCPVVAIAPCQEVVVNEPDLEDLPVLLHCSGDGGAYISAGVVIARHPSYGQNLDFHRCMQFSKNEMAMRVVRGRHLDTYLQELDRWMWRCAWATHPTCWPPRPPRWRSGWTSRRSPTHWSRCLW